MLWASKYAVAVVAAIVTAAVCCQACDSGWEPCPAWFVGSFPPSAYALECLNITVPLDYERPFGTKINAFASRLRSNRVGGPLGQVWMMPGGPGWGGALLLSISLSYNFMDVFGGDYDLVFADHRGIGLSSMLTCPNPDKAHAVECHNYIVETIGAAALRQYTVSNAARDLHMLIMAGKENGVPHYLYGWSYGTYLMNRYLQIFHHSFERPAGLILDGVLSPDMVSYLNFDFGVNNVGRDFMTSCASDLFCSTNFHGENPYNVMQNLFHALDSELTTCFDQLELANIFLPPNSLHLGLATVLGKLLESVTDRVLIPPILFRLQRCSTEDVQALNNMMAWANVTYFSAYPAANTLFGDVPLAVNIIVSELMTQDHPYPSLREVVHQNNQLFFTTSTCVDTREYSLLWSHYSRDKYWNKFAPINGLPVLILNGNLDFATPLYTAAEAYQAGPSVTFEVIDTAVHGTIFYSPVDNSPVPCGLQMMKSFVESGATSVDTSCLSHLIPIDFSGVTASSQQASENLFGTPDMWELQQ